LSAFFVGPVSGVKLFLFKDHEWLDNVFGFPVAFMNKNQDDDDEVDNTCDD
jgi:hypothetical protein